MIDLPAELPPNDADHKAAQATLERQAKEQREQIARLEASLRSLRGNPDFLFWINDYFGTDVTIKLQQLRDATADNLPMARQRWLDAEQMLNDLREVASEPVPSLDTDSLGA